MPYTRARDRPRVETHDFAMAALGPDRLASEGVDAIYRWHKENGVHSQSQIPLSIRFPRADD